MDLAQISQVDNALLQACLEGNEDALAHAVRHGALATRARDAMGATPLHMACLGGHLDIAAWCADQGLDVTTADAQGALPLHTACFNGHLDVARWLATKAKTSRKEALNQPDLQGGTPLHHAALGGSLKLCRWLLFHGADERATTVDGLTPERVAMEAGEGSQKIVTLLRCHATHLQATEPDRPPFSVAKAAPAEPTAADAAVDASRKVEGILGCRMVGGGFGGAALAVCAPGTDVDRVVEDWRDLYHVDGRHEPRLLVVEPGAGATPPISSYIRPASSESSSTNGMAPPFIVDERCASAARAGPRFGLVRFELRALKVGAAMRGEVRAC